MSARARDETGSARLLSESGPYLPGNRPLHMEFRNPQAGQLFGRTRGPGQEMPPTHAVLRDGLTLFARLMAPRHLRGRKKNAEYDPCGVLLRVVAAPLAAWRNVSDALSISAQREGLT